MRPLRSKSYRRSTSKKPFPKTNITQSAHEDNFWYNKKTKQTSYNHRKSGNQRRRQNQHQQQQLNAHNDDHRGPKFENFQISKSARFGGRRWQFARCNCGARCAPGAYKGAHAPRGGATPTWRRPPFSCVFCSGEVVGFSRVAFERVGVFEFRVQLKFGCSFKNNFRIEFDRWSLLNGSQKGWFVGRAVSRLTSVIGGVDVFDRAKLLVLCCVKIFDRRS